MILQENMHCGHVWMFSNVCRDSHICILLILNYFWIYFICYIVVKQIWVLISWEMVFLGCICLRYCYLYFIIICLLLVQVKCMNFAGILKWPLLKAFFKWGTQCVSHLTSVQINSLTQTYFSEPQAKIWVKKEQMNLA